MTALSEISKRRLTPEEKEEIARHQTQARVGLASNVIGLGAGTAAVASALKEPGLRKKVGTEMKPPPYKISRKTKVLAGGALGLQLANMGGDIVANRVLARSAATPEKKVTKSMESITQIYISKADKTTGHGHNLLSDEELRSEIKPARDRLRRSNTAAGAILGGATGSSAGLIGSDLAHRPWKAGKFAAVTGAGTAAGALGGGLLARSAVNRSAKRIQNDPQTRRRAETAIILRREREKEAARLVGKAYRRYDPEADRQRRLGLAAGTGALGAGLLGQQAVSRMTLNTYNSKGAKMRGHAFKPGKGRSGALFTAGAVGSGALGLAAYRRGISERNNPWD